MSFALGNLEREPSNGICLAADLSNGGGWFQSPCDFPNGLFICEMSRKQINTTKDIDISSIITTPAWTKDSLNALFPKMPDVPFLEYALNSQADQAANDKFVEQDKISAGSTTYSWVMCVKAGTSLRAKVDAYPDWAWLKIGGKDVTTQGRWVYGTCNLDTSQASWAFKLTKAMSALNTWSLCYNGGYELAMPVYADTTSLLKGTPISFLETALSGWYPYQVGNQTGQYYANFHKWFRTTAYWKIPQSGQQCPK
jgi:hypothetical protein